MDASPESFPRGVQRRATVSETPTGTWSPRTKPVAIACERCRRRKIRCDGDTPCSTCQRFSIVCVRPQKTVETQAALEQRVQQLEAQLVELTSNMEQTQRQETDEIFWNEQGAPPSLHLVTKLDIPDPEPMSAIRQSGQFLERSSLAGFDIPRIEVADCAGLSPMSQAGTSLLQPCAPETPSPISGPRDRGFPRSNFLDMPPSPMSSSLTVPYLSPVSLPQSVSSRRSSVSSIGLDMEYRRSDFPIMNFPDRDTLSRSPCPVSPYSAIAPTPTRFEAETLLDTFFIQVNSWGHSIDRQMFQVFLDVTYTPSNSAYPRPVALFHVFMAMATALRTKMERSGSESYLLNNCYRLAMEQVQTPEFWSQPLASEAARLFVLFAQASQQGSPVSVADQIQFYEY
ncbi:hypothetical protein BBP40_000572 [Aspergillus hancockii]|nr:hypothetical protein BBP40_000572 [Aspergillus hancockii]